MMSCVRALALSAMASAMLAGCGPGLVCPDEKHALTVTLSESYRSGGFTPLTNGDEIDVYFGSQGGQHLWLAVRIEHVDTAGSWFDVQLAARGGDGTSLGSGNAGGISWQVVEEGTDGVVEYEELTLFLDEEPASAGYPTFEVTAAVEDGCGQVGASEVTLTARAFQ